MRKDVRIVAPAAVGVFGLPETPAADLEKHLLEVEVRELRNTLQQLRVTAYTITNFAVCLVRLLGGDEVVVPHDLSERMMGAQLSAQEIENGDFRLVLRERQPDPIQIEGANHG